MRDNELGGWLRTTENVLLFVSAYTDGHGETRPHGNSGRRERHKTMRLVHTLSRNKLSRLRSRFAGA